MFDKEAVFTAQEASVRLKISLPWLRRLTQQKQIGHVRLGRRVLYRPEHLERWLKTHEIRVQG